MKVAAYVGLGLVSAGILAAVSRHRAQATAGRRARTLRRPRERREIVGEYVTAPEPVPAT